MKQAGGGGGRSAAPASTSRGFNGCVISFGPKLCIATTPASIGGLRIRSSSAGKQSVSVQEILQSVICKPAERWTRGDDMRISDCLVSMGWGRTRITRSPSGKQEWCYVEPRHPSHPDRAKKRVKRRAKR